MAVQVGKKKTGAQIVKTPAPLDEAANTKIADRGYGQMNSLAAGGASSIPPGQTVESALARNLRESGTDEGLAQVIARGVAGRGDTIPADDAVADRRRTVSADQYPTTFGMRRQQMDYAKIGVADLPASTSDSAEEPVRKPD